VMKKARGFFNFFFKSLLSDPALGIMFPHAVQTTVFFMLTMLSKSITVFTEYE